MDRCGSTAKAELAAKLLPECNIRIDDRPECVMNENADQDGDEDGRSLRQHCTAADEEGENDTSIGDEDEEEEDAIAPRCCDKCDLPPPCTMEELMALRTSPG